MTLNHKPTGTAVPIWSGLIYGGICSIFLTILGAYITARMIDKEIIAWGSSGYAVIVILLVSSWIGSVVSSQKIKRQKFAVCLLSGVTYFGMLMVTTALLFGGRYSGVGETALLVFCGSILGALMKFQRKSTVKRRKINGYRG